MTSADWRARTAFRGQKLGIAWTGANESHAARMRWGRHGECINKTYEIAVLALGWRGCERTLCELIPEPAAASALGEP